MRFISYNNTSNVIFDLVPFSDLENFLKFATGVKTVPPTHIEVETDEVETIFASTCLMKITLPNDLRDKDQESFNSCMVAVIRGNGGGTFNTV